MALTDEVTARYSSQLLINASNPQSAASTSIDTTRLANAATDVQADFEIECGTTYDNANARHVAVCVPAVFAKLLVYTGQADQSVYDAAKARMAEAKLVLGRNRIKASTDSLLDPTEDTTNAKPASDRSHFKGYVAGATGDPTFPTDNR